jgi:glycerophosphoryl diester phosphodiesterase
MSDWPYPFWIAHRGGGKLAPENTLAALRLGAAHGWRMFECDAKLSADGVLFLLHDDTLERTTNGHGVAGRLPWGELARLDAGSWHSPAYTGEPIPTLENLARHCLANGLLLNIEIKPTPGAEEATGRAVAELAARLWAHAATPPLLSSFQPTSLRGAQQVAPELPRALVLETLWDGWLEAARTLGCRAVTADYPQWNTDTVAQAKAAGLRVLSYTVNDEAALRHLTALDTDGVFTDRVDRFGPAAG